MTKLLRKGFTLIELLVVIGILAVLMAGVVTLIDPVDKNRAANDARSQSNIANIATAQEAYAATHNGFYAASEADLVTAGEIKTPTNWPNGWVLTTVNTPNPCTSGTTCTQVIVCGTLRSRRYVPTSGTTYPFWRYNTATGVSCPATACTAAGTCQP